MSLPLISLEAYVELIPEPAEYTPDHPNWFSLDYARQCVRLSESGMSKARRRLGNRWEHKCDGRIYIFTPYWIRGYFIDLNWSEHMSRKGGR